VGSRLKTEDLWWSMRRTELQASTCFLLSSSFLYFRSFMRQDRWRNGLRRISGTVRFWVGYTFYSLPLFWYFWVSIWTLVLIDYHVMRCIIDLIVSVIYLFMLLLFWALRVRVRRVHVAGLVTPEEIRVHVAGPYFPVLILIFWGVTSFGGIRARFD
jgi:hypothetical protein